MASTTTDLVIAVRESDSWNRRLTITVPAERVQRIRSRVTDQLTRNVRMPGFRKGRLPQRVVEQRFGPSIDQETIDQVIQESYREALEAEGITPISQGQIAEIEYEKGTDLRFEVEVEVKPEIELPRLAGFTVKRPESIVTDEDVDSLLERLRDERATWTELEEGARPDYGDQVLVTISDLGEEDEEEATEPRSYRIVLGEDQAIPDVEAAILTLAPGESGEFEVKFPDDFPDESRRGQPQQLRIEVKEARSKVLPEIDDEFAKSLGDFENVEALRTRIAEDLQRDAEQRAESEVRRTLIDEILSANPFEAPASMVERYLDYMMGEDPDADSRKREERSPEEEEQFQQFREQLRPQAEWAIKRSLVVERITELEGLAATQDEIDERVEAIAQENDRSASEIWIQLEKSGQLESIEREISEDKVFDFLKSQNTIT